jgi:hypothetical protein
MRWVNKYKGKGNEMRLRIFSVLACMIIIPATLLAQGLSREDIRKTEWQMKSQQWKMIHERQNNPMILDQADYDVRYWELTVDVTDIAGQNVTGRVRMVSQSVINGMTTIEYNLHSAMVVDSVLVNGLPAAHTHIGDMLSITLDRAYNIGETITTIVTYTGHPPGGGFGSLTWNTHSGHPIISSLSEPEG